MRRLFFFFVLVLLSAFAHELQAQVLSRKVLAFYDPKEDKRLTFQKTHLRAEMPLNYLGLSVIHHNVRQPFPSHESMNDFVGILSWYSYSKVFPDPTDYCRWLNREMSLGRKLVILGYPGFLDENPEKVPQVCKETLRLLGVEYLGETTDNPFFLQVKTQANKNFEFERKLALHEGLIFTHFKPISESVTKILEMIRKDLPDSPSSLIFYSDHGGLAYYSFTSYWDQEIQTFHWRINPFYFFKHAFHVSHLPRLDTTTINGRRIFFTHIDGDGSFNISKIDRKSFSAQVIFDEILKGYPQLPHTVSLITGYFDQERFNNTLIDALYKKIFSLMNVEPSVHGYAHPLIWAEKKLALKIPGYQYSDYQEIIGSVEKMNAKLQKVGVNKKVQLYQWTGDCVLSESQIALSEKIHMLNMNGGDSRFDRNYLSYGFLSPLSILKGSARQIYSAAPNENIYTDLWSGGFYGFRDVKSTFENTELPFRVKPINIYYHYYSAERNESLIVLKDLFDFVLGEEIFPIFASQYVRIVKDFFESEIIKTPSGFKIKNSGSLRTVRFDEENRSPDIMRSSGIIGFKKFQNHLYVHLDESLEHQIVWSDQNQNQNYLVESNFELKNVEYGRDSIRFQFRSWLKPEAIFRVNHANHEYEVKLLGESYSFKSDQENRIKVSFDLSEQNTWIQAELIKR